FFAHVVRVNADGSDVSEWWAKYDPGKTHKVVVMGDDLVERVRVGGIGRLVFGFEELIRPGVRTKDQGIEFGDLGEIRGRPGALGIAGWQLQWCWRVHLRNCFGIWASWPRKYCGSTGSSAWPR